MQFSYNWPYHFLYDLGYGKAEMTAISNHTVQIQNYFCPVQCCLSCLPMQLAWDNLASTPATKPLRPVLSYQ
jgi:hypothetical protein